MKGIFNIFGKKNKLNANNTEAVKEYILNEGLLKLVFNVGEGYELR